MVTNMSRDKRYQKLLNSPRWAEVKRIVWQRAGGLCERCKRDGIADRGVPYITPGVDCHHKIPVESAKTEQEMERLAYDWQNNIELLCVPCHIKTHQEMRSHTKEKVKENKARARARFLEANDPNYKTEDNQGTMQENKRLGIFGTMNYEKLKDMTMDERKLAVTNHAKDVLTRKTKDGKGPQIPYYDFNSYDVTAEYTIIDCR